LSNCYCTGIASPGEEIGAAISYKIIDLQPYVRLLHFARTDRNN
jgi:hypothetical protein